MISFDDLRMIDAIAHSSSLSEAARTLLVTPSALSMRLRKLEAHVGVQLATRDARKLGLTEEGIRLAEQGIRLVQQLEDLTESLRPHEGQLKGRLRLAAPFGFGRMRLAPLLARFAKLHPQLRVDLDLRETPWLVRGSCDAVIHIGHITDSSWTARTLASNERWLCASPGYLKRLGEPRSPSDLASHRCICIRENDEDTTFWNMSDKAQHAAIRIDPAMTTNDGGVARRWAEQDLGLVLRSQWDAADAIASGTLVRVLSQWKFEVAPILLLTPTIKQRSRKVQVFSNFLQDALHSDS